MSYGFKEIMRQIDDARKVQDMSRVTDWMIACTRWYINVTKWYMIHKHVRI